MIVYFKDRDGNRRDIGRANDFEDARHIIYSFLRKRGYESLYWRYVQDGPEVFVDVGSWSEFFYVYTGPDFDVDEYMKNEGR